MYALPAFHRGIILEVASRWLKPAFHRGIILEVISNRRVAVVIIKASYFEVFIGVTHKFVIQKGCT